ncbi:MAG TPA: hypothetical protein VHO70_03935 [Chitinispirillaceae bacterium]|nr:hypothetical protein [Chitinispirillaceae bacterium]
MNNNKDNVYKTGKMSPHVIFLAGFLVIAITFYLIYIYRTSNSKSRDRYNIFIERPYTTTLKDLCDELEPTDTTRRKDLCNSLQKVINEMSHPDSGSKVIVQVFRGSANGISFIKDRNGASQFTIPLAFFLFPLAVLVIWYIGLVYIKDRLRIHDRNEALRREIRERQDARENELPTESLISQLMKRLCIEEAEQEPRSDIKGLNYLKIALQICANQKKDAKNENQVKEITNTLCEDLMNKKDNEELKRIVLQLCEYLTDMKDNEKLKNIALLLCDELKNDDDKQKSKIETIRDN